MIQYIDAADNMQFEYLENKIMPDFIKLCNPEWNEEISEEEAFINALILADGFWNVYIKHAVAEVEAIEIILKKIQNSKEPYIFFDNEMPFRKIKKYIDNDKVKYIIFKSRRKGYDVRIIIDSFKFKEEIITKNLEEVKKIINTDDIIYIDNNGKLCCTETLDTAKKIIKYNEGD